MHSISLSLAPSAVARLRSPPEICGLASCSKSFDLRLRLCGEALSGSGHQGQRPSKSQFWAGMTHLWSVLGWSYRFNVSYGQKHEQVRFRPFFLVHSRAFA